MIRVRLSLLSPALEAGVRALLKIDSEIVVIDGIGSREAPNDAEAVDVHVLTSAAFMRQAERWRAEDRLEGIIILGAEELDLRALWARSAPWGVLPLEASAEELCAAVRAVATGLVVGTRPLLVTPEESATSPGPLTEREMEILGMLSTGLANKQIAAELGISEHTVKFHVSSIYAKLNVANRTEAVREGLRNGWIAL